MGDASREAIVVEVYGFDEKGGGYALAAGDGAGKLVLCEVDVFQTGQRGEKSGGYASRELVVGEVEEIEVGEVEGVEELPSEVVPAEVEVLQVGVGAKASREGSSHSIPAEGERLEAFQPTNRGGK